MGSSSVFLIISYLSIYVVTGTHGDSTPIEVPKFKIFTTILHKSKTIFAVIRVYPDPFGPRMIERICIFQLLDICFGYQ